MLLNLSRFHLCPLIFKHNQGQHCLGAREAMRAQTVEPCPVLTSPTAIALLIWSFNWHIVLDIFMGTTWHFGPHIHYCIMIRLEWLACLSPRAFMTSLCWECPVLSARHFEILSFLKALRNQWFYIRCRMRNKKSSFLHIFFLILSSTWVILPSVSLCMEVDFHPGGCGAHLIGWVCGSQRRGTSGYNLCSKHISKTYFCFTCLVVWPVCMFMYRVCALPMEARWRCRVLWNWTHSCGPLCRCWGPNPVNKYSSLMSHLTRPFQNILKICSPHFLL